MPLIAAFLCVPINAAVQNGSVAPVNAVAYRNSVAVAGDTATFGYAGSDGRMCYEWRKPVAGLPLFGSLTVTATRAGGKPVALEWGASKADWTGSVRFAQSAWVKNGSDATLAIQYDRGTIQLRVKAQGKALIVSIEADNPVIRQIDAGGWLTTGARKIPVPYDPFDAIYYPQQDLFASAYFDWTYGHATSQQFPKLVYGALTDGSYNKLEDRLILVASWHFHEIFANQPNAPSKYLKQLAGRTVFDIWSSSFDEVTSAFERLRDYGIGDCAAIIHNWQHQGYDNGLPGHYPAAGKLGGEAALRRAVQAVKDDGCYAALHENYVDYYPNYEGFDEREVSLDSHGNPMKAWFNAGTKIQSFASKPSVMGKLAMGQAPEIRRRYGTNASFLDVNSSVTPWWRADMEVGTPGAGMFATFRDEAVKLWRTLGRIEDGPVFGEGNHHFFWSGELDGVEAQFGSGLETGMGPNSPLLVDFDLGEIHGLQVNHGMGYYERWTKNRDDVERPEFRDAYRMQEIAYGHAPFASWGDWNEPAIAWVEAGLIGPAAKRYGTAKAHEIRYWLDGKWVDEDAAARAGNWNCVRVGYSNGDTVVANGSGETLEYEGFELPQFGWVMRGEGFLAYTALRGGVVVDYAETADSVFANARNDMDGPGAARVSVSEFLHTGQRRFRVTYEWKVNHRLSEDARVFVHFLDQDGRIVFQQDHRPSRPTPEWRPGETVTDGPWDVEIPKGDVRELEVVAGLYSGRGRARLAGVDLGQRRYGLGVVAVRGDEVAFTPAFPRAADVREKARVNSNGDLIDFGSLRTDGSVKLTREGDEWVLRPLSRDRNFTVELRKERFGKPENADDGGVYWRLRMGGAKAYRWKSFTGRR